MNPEQNTLTIARQVLDDAQYLAALPRTATVARTQVMIALADAAPILARQAEQLEQLTEQLESGEASDGHHTHNELYEYRTLYHAHAVRHWLTCGYPVTKSWRHADGELCFGGGWFIVTAQLPTGQVTNHYPEEDWPLFDVPEVDLPAPWDGHTPEDAAARIRAALNGETDD